MTIGDLLDKVLAIPVSAVIGVVTGIVVLLAVADVAWRWWYARHYGDRPRA